MSRPLCSVVIPVYNGARFIDAALRSVFGQTWRPLEVIVADDGSTDDSAAVAARWPEVRLLRLPHAGDWAARNAAIAEARGELVALLDVDDLWTPDKLEVQVGHLLAHPELGYVAARYQNFLDPDVPRPSWLSDAQLTEPQDGGVANFVVRADALRRVGAFVPRVGADLDWCLRAQDAGVKNALLPVVLLHRRIHAGNFSHEVRVDAGLKLEALRASIARKRAAQGK